MLLQEGDFPPRLPRPVVVSSGTNLNSFSLKKLMSAPFQCATCPLLCKTYHGWMKHKKSHRGHILLHRQSLLPFRERLQNAAPTKRQRVKYCWPEASATAFDPNASCSLFEGGGFSGDESELAQDDKCEGLSTSEFLIDQLRFKSGNLTPADRNILSVGSFVTSTCLGRAHLNMFLKLVHDPDVELKALPKDSRKFNQCLTAAVTKCKPFAGTALNTMVIDVSDINTVVPTVEFHYKEVLPALLDLLHSHKGTIHWHFESRMCPSRNCRVYDGDHTGNYWRDIELHALTPGCLPFVIKLYSDATNTGKPTAFIRLCANLFLAYFLFLLCF